MKTRAAVAWEAGKPLQIEEIDIAGPKAGEVLIQIKATGVCHTDAFTLSGDDPEGIFPAVLGHEGGGVVVEVGLRAVAPDEGAVVVGLGSPSGCERGIAGCRVQVSSRNSREFPGRMVGYPTGDRGIGTGCGVAAAAANGCLGICSAV